MADELRVQRLLERSLEGDLTPEQVCAASPDLLDDVRERWERCRLIELELGEVFSRGVPEPSGVGPRDTPQRRGELPPVPGYRIDAVLGRGGVGVVYRAYHEPLDRTVALKMLLSGEYASRLERARFLREARSVAALRHANVVQVYDVGEVGGMPFFTMELMDGGTLAEQLRGVPQPAARAASLTATLADAVACAHQAGIMHRDLKPANVLLTAGGLPKISDFGLARRVGGGDALTLTGMSVGTPSYMAPEQASGRASAVGPAADIYALGALLYETLTGRPPFRGESAIETERQLIAEEPAQPSRLNARVPRDLETICLQCLQKDPRRRYATAALLAEDLRRFGRGEPILARPVGRLERLQKWVRRHPAVSVATLAATVLCVAGAAVALRVQHVRAEHRRAVLTALHELADLESWERWSEARATLGRTQTLVDANGFDDLRPALNAVRRDLNLVDRLDAIHLSQATQGELPFYRSKADHDYEQTFADAGLPGVGGNVGVAVERVKTSAVRPALVAALDQWAVTAKQQPRRQWLLSVAADADPDPSPSRRLLRDPTARKDSATLLSLAQQVDVQGSSPSVFLAFADRLHEANLDPAAFVRRVQKAHPADFWANLMLGDDTLFTSPVQAGLYYRAALAARPDAAVGYCAVGDSLHLHHEPHEAIDYYNMALKIDPNYARAMNNRGNALKSLGQIDAAIKCYQATLRMDPNYTWSHFDWADALVDEGRPAESIEHFQSILAVEPKVSQVLEGYRGALIRLGRGEEARLAWGETLDAGHSTFEDWTGYPELCLFLGNGAEYRRARVLLLARFGSSSNSAITEPLARACLLAPADDAAQLAAISAIADHAETAERAVHSRYTAYAQFARGLAAYRAGRFDDALAIMRGPVAKVLGPCPGLVTALSLQAKGQSAAARHALAVADEQFDWTSGRANRRDLWINHVLRKEAEAAVLPQLSDFLRGGYPPRDNDERVAFAAVCQASGRYAEAARLYVDAFAADPALADSAGLRLSAARAAADARGDASALREQARQWIGLDLAQRLNRAADEHTQKSHDQLRIELSSWQVDPDFAPLRDPAAVGAFSPAERQACSALWQSVQTAVSQIDAAD